MGVDNVRLDNASMNVVRVDLCRLDDRGVDIAAATWAAALALHSVSDSSSKAGAPVLRSPRRGQESPRSPGRIGKPASACASILRDRGDGLGGVLRRSPSGSQETANEGREFCRLLHLGHVAAILDHGKPRTRNAALIDRSRLERCDRVLASPHQQCRGADRGQ